VVYQVGIVDAFFQGGFRGEIVWIEWLGFFADGLFGIVYFLSGERFE
jgi:hypothetical protein